MDALSQKGEHDKAKRAFDKLHTIYLWMIANWYNPEEYVL